MKWLPKMCTVESYIAACLELLEKWHWLTAERATHILKAGMLDKPPICHILSAVSDLDWEEMNQVPYGLSKDVWPIELQHFISKCVSLRLQIPRKHVLVGDHDFGANTFRKMSPKKKEEVIRLSALTAEICSLNNIKHVVDFGSGLGYVDRILTTHYGLTVLGLEMDEEKVRRAREFGGGVEYKAAYLTGDTASQVKETIEDWLKGSLACFIALHACGDLSIEIGRLFGEMRGSGGALLLVPCCYHLSKSRPLSVQVQSSGLVGTTVLRLASDGTAERWRLTTPEQHLAHARSALARALLELFPASEGGEIKRKQRHAVRAVARKDWEKCFESCVERFSGVDKDQLREAWTTNEWRLKQIEAFSCLQVCLQAVAEGLVLADTFLFLSEVTRANIHLYRVFDAVVSPRSIAFVVTS